MFRLYSIALFICFSLSVSITNAQEGTVQLAQNQVMDGNEELGLSFQAIKCGLDYVQTTHKLGQRGTINGVVQPATYNITGIPANAVIEKAFVWSSYSGTHLAHNVTIVNPLAVVDSFPMIPIGHCRDKCWAYDSTKTYRADVTSIIDGNGNYIISGLITNPPTPTKDTDGATLFIIFSDSTSPDMGHLFIKDGCKVKLGVNNIDSITGFVACDTANDAKAFTIVADLQLGNPTAVLNGDTVQVAFDWMNFIDTTTQMNFQQTTSYFEMLVSGDCYNVIAIGIQWFVPGCATALQVSTTMTPDSCGNCIATGTVNATGGYPPYSYQWDAAAGNQTTATATGLCAGTYTVLVTDTTGCPVFVETIVVPGYSTSFSATNATCNAACDGSATVIPIGGAPPYTYLWDANANNQTNALATGLCPGWYFVSVTDTVNCTKVDSVLIGFNGYTINFTFNQASCAVSCNGTATAIPSGATPPYTYEWDANANNQTNALATGLCPGTYLVTITDDNGCTEVDSVTIGAGSLSINFTALPISCAPNCDGQAAASPVGGNAPYVYEWDAAANNQTNALATGLCPGNYSVTITDDNGCSVVDIVTIGANSITINFSSDSTTCFNNCDGEATASPGGATPPYLFQWDAAANNQTNITATGLCSGTYTVTVTDDNGCTRVDNITIYSPVSITINFNVVYTGCLANITGLVGGGTPPYIYNWNVGGTTNSLIGVASGVYIMQVLDDKGCLTQNSITITTNSISSTNASSTPLCDNTGNTGTATASATGGNAPYSFIWDDANNQTGATATGLDAGTYNVTITNADGCTGTATVTVDIMIAPEVTGTVKDESCLGLQDGSVTITVSGSGPFTYLWSNDSTSKDLDNAGAGMYFVTVTDTTNNCTAVDSFRVKALEQDCDSLNIPTAFTPNGDGMNERWTIRGLQNYPNVIIEVYNRWGTLVYQSETGYPVTWDGYYNGSLLPSGVYYYIIDLGVGDKLTEVGNKLTGNITLVY